MSLQELLTQVEEFLEEQKPQVLPAKPTFEERRRWDYFLQSLASRIAEVGDKVAGF